MRRFTAACPAQRVVFLIDACREGIEQDSMGPAGVEDPVDLPEVVAEHLGIRNWPARLR